MSQRAGSQPEGASLHLRSRLLPASIVLLGLLQLTSPHRAWMVLLVGLGGAWLIAGLWARSLRRGLRLERELRRPWSQVGDEMLERISLSNRGWAPAISVEVEDHSNLPGDRRSRVVSVGGHEVNTWHQSAVCHRRGVYRVGPTTLTAADPFGVYEVELHQPARSSVIVLPPTIPVSGFSVSPAGRLADGHPRRTGLGRSVTSAGARAYLPGDSLRWVHWPTSAHQGDLYIRLFDRVSSGDWWIVLDLETSVQAGAGFHSTAEHGVVLAASLAARGLQDGRSVGLVAQGESGSLTWLAAAAGPRQRWKLLQELARVRQGPRPLSELLRAGASQLQRPASLLVVTPAPPAAWSEALEPLLARSARATVFLFDRASYDPEQATPGEQPVTDRPRAEVHVIRRQWMEAGLPDLDPDVDWRRTRLEDLPWRKLTP